MNPDLFIQDSIKQAMLSDMKNDWYRWLQFLDLHNVAASLRRLHATCNWVIALVAGESDVS